MTKRQPGRQSLFDIFKGKENEPMREDQMDEGKGVDDEENDDTTKEEMRDDTEKMMTLKTGRR